MMSRLGPASLALALLITAGCAGNTISVSTPADVPAVRAAIDDTVNRFLRGDRTVGPEFTRHAASLTRVMESGSLSEADRLVATYSRGKARYYVNLVRSRRGETIDLSLARQTLQDFDDTVAIGDRIGGFVPLVRDAEYLASSVALEWLKQEQLAFAYWNRCAERGHAGCASNVAYSLVTGDAGQPQDIPRALELHRHIFATGITFRCAGAFSALAIAEIVHFTQLRAADDDEVTWASRGIALLDELQSKEGTTNVCFRSQFLISEYLFRLARGEKRVELLAGPLDLKSDPPSQAIASYLLGRIDEATFASMVRSNRGPVTRCSMHFKAMWHAHINRDGILAQKHYEALLATGAVACRIELVYAGYLGYRSAGA